MAARHLLLSILFAGPLFGQQLNHAVMAFHSDALPRPHLSIMAADTVKILAVMVQFQQDSDTRTSGDGRFVLGAATDSVIDAPPRNQRYFADHLSFVTNYFRKASKGKVIVQATVPDTVYTLPSVMGRYAPPKAGPNTVLGDLARDTWRAVDSSGLVSDFSQYNCFIVFHAGVGRDIDLVSILGYDPTPLDIPSLYLGLNAFKTFYGTSYDGIPVNGGRFKITNSIIIPETESRTLPGIQGNVLLQLSINGLMCASVGNYLGLPDLFDTNTGRSGIGRFGLMDGQAIFSFSGLFPPEPSAWEKYWLGWVDPIQVRTDSQTVALPAVGIASASGEFARPDTIYRIPIGPGEYYLIENRNRDPQRNGQTVVSTFNRVVRTQRFLRDTAGFSSFDLKAIRGVVTDVEDLDWSLPGGVDASSGTFFDGGLLIWHIDESAIANGLLNNGVNANPGRRGVDLEEADGSQDIGQQYAAFTGGSGSEEGTALDFWYRGNGSPINKNEFSSATLPNSNSNNGANSHIVVRDFSARGSRMTARVVWGDQQTVPLAGYPKRIGETLPPVSLSVGEIGVPGSTALIVATSGIQVVTPTRNPVPVVLGPGKLYAWRTDGSALPQFQSSGLIANATTVPSSSRAFRFLDAPLIKDLNGDSNNEIVVTQEFRPSQTPTTNTLLKAWTVTDMNRDSLADEFFSTGVKAVAASVVVASDSLLAFGGSQASLYLVKRNGNVQDSLTLLPDTNAAVVGVVFLSPTAYVATLSNGKLVTNLAFISGSSQTVSAAFGSAIAAPPVAGRFPLGGVSTLLIAFATKEGNLFLVNDRFVPLPGFPVSTGGEITQPPALADMDGDGIRDIVVFSGGNICAYNYAGTSLDYFPIRASPTQVITSHPVIADVDGDGSVDIVAVTQNGLVAAYNRFGRMAAGFPLQAGVGRHSVAVFDVQGPSLSAVGIGLAVASSDDGSLSAWQTGSSGRPFPSALRPWPQYQRDAQHSGLATETLSGSPLSTEFFPKNRAYNWPNPVTDGKTFIRYFVKNDARVNIRVFDLAGDLVTEFGGPGVGGVDNEVAWNVSGVQTGVYLARIEASGAGGSGTAIIKVAVVK